MTVVGFAALFAFAAETKAQNPPPVRSLAPITRHDQSRPAIKPEHMPPPGMCRVWIDNVPPAQQPAPTDCATAIRNKPQNGRVIFSDDKAGKDDARREGRDGKSSKPKKPDGGSSG
jgi:hypothetical protein